MSLSRVALIAEVAGQLVQGLALAGMTSADTVGNLLGPTNRALRAMGVAEADLAASVATGDEPKAIAYLTYFALSTILANASATEVDLTSPGGGGKFSQAVDRLREQWKIAAAEASSYGLVVWTDLNMPHGAPFAGGISRSDKELRGLDDDRMPPMFERDQPGGRSIIDAWRRD